MKYRLNNLTIILDEFKFSKRIDYSLIVQQIDIFEKSKVELLNSPNFDKKHFSRINQVLDQLISLGNIQVENKNLKIL